MLSGGGRIQYELAGRSEAISCGGIGAFHTLVHRIGLPEEIDQHLHLLKVHLPYHESDHVLNIAYNVLVGGQRLEDIEYQRQDVTFLNALDASRLPDPTTAGDFTRRFGVFSIETLMHCINRSRSRLWQARGQDLLKEEALIDVDGTFTPTTGWCKEGIGLSYNGVWGYHPLVVSLANTKEILFLENRPANVPSHKGAEKWIDAAIDLVAPHTKRICLRGDTDFSLTRHFDRWSERADFVFGMDASPGLVARANAVNPENWQVLDRKARYEVKTQERSKPENVRARIVKDKGLKNIRLDSEHVTEIAYTPGRAQGTYRLIMLKKNLSIERGENTLIDDIRYFFYITTRWDLTPSEVVELANGRCDQENVIEQLKNGVNAMRMPVDNLLSNWAYMVMAALAWNLKAWFALTVRRRERRDQLLKMEFRGFLRSLVWIPAQVLKHARHTVYRILNHNGWTSDFFSAWETIRKLKPA
jgi:hypothetical protein